MFSTLTDPIIRNFVFIISFLSIGETVATFAGSGNITFIRLLLTACDIGTKSVSEEAFTSFGGILSSQEVFLMSRDFSKNATWDGFA